MQKSRCPRGGRGAGNGVDMARLGEKERSSPELYEKKGREPDTRTGHWKPGIESQISKTKLAKGSLKPKGVGERSGR